MSCSICNTSPCICGDSYYKLTDNAFLNLLSKMKKIAKDRGINADICIDNIDIDRYLGSKDLKMSNDKGFLSILETFTNIPIQYKNLLAARKGKALIQVYEEMKDLDTAIFPLRFAIAKFVNVNKRQLRLVLMNLFYEHIMDFEHLIIDDLAAVSREDFNKACMGSDSDFSYALYKQQMSYTAYMTQLSKATNEKFERSFIDHAGLYIAALDTIRNIMSDDAIGVFKDLFNFMFMAACHTTDERNKAVNQFEEKGISEQVKDILYSCDYAFCQVLENSNIQIPTDLKV